MNLLGDEEDRLPFPTIPTEINGVKIEEYIIPDEDKAEVLKQLYLSDPVPSLDEKKYDLHAGKMFVVRDFRVTREHNRNWLVSPYYYEAGGTVIDWLPPEFADDL